MGDKMTDIKFWHDAMNSDIEAIRSILTSVSRISHANDNDEGNDMNMKRKAALGEAKEKLRSANESKRSLKAEIRLLSNQLVREKYGEKFEEQERTLSQLADEITKAQQTETNGGNNNNKALKGSDDSNTSSLSSSMKRLLSSQSRKKKNRNEQESIATENLQIARDGTYRTQHGKNVSIATELSNAIQNSNHYHHYSNDKIVDNNPNGGGEKDESSKGGPSSSSLSSSSSPHFDTRISVSNCGAIRAALDICNSLNNKEHITHMDNDTYNSLHSRHVGVMNFASAKKPGGGYLRGSSAQEESLCRSSLLYSCLEPFSIQNQNRRDYYYQINSRKEFAGRYTDCAIFSPLVPIIRGDERDSSGLYLLDEPRFCSFLTIPAPNKRVMMHNKSRSSTSRRDRSDELIDLEAKRIIEGRIHRALQIFRENGCTDLVLGAFGCGVFGNNPSTVAAAFRNELASKSGEFYGCFASIVFAVLVPTGVDPERDVNYNAFASAFAPRPNRG